MKLKLGQMTLIVGVLALCTMLIAILFSSGPGNTHRSPANGSDEDILSDNNPASKGNTVADSGGDSDEDYESFRQPGASSSDSHGKGEPPGTGGKGAKKSSKRAGSGRRGMATGMDSKSRGTKAEASSHQGGKEPASATDSFLSGVRIITREEFLEYIDTVKQTPDEQPVKREKGTLAGYVIDENGTPVGGATVILRIESIYLTGENPNKKVQPGFPKKTTTDLNGEFWFAGLPLESYTIMVECNGYVSEYLAAIRLNEEGEVYLEVVLKNSLCVAGTVIDKEGIPIENARVTASYKIEAGPYFTSEAFTNSQGRFNIPVRKGTSNIVEATKTGYTTASLSAVPQGKMDCILVLEAIPTGFVTGRVLDGTTGNPLTEITVDDEELFAADGYFKVERPVSSRVKKLRIGSPGYSTRTVIYTLNKSTTVDLGDIALPLLLTLKGIVVVEGSEPPEAVAGASVKLQPPGATARTTVTGSDGTFCFGEVATGTVILETTKTGYFMDSTEVAIELPDPENPALREVHVVVNLPQGGFTIEGTVTEATSDTPIAGAALTVVENPGLTAASGEDGSYNISGIPFASFRVKASKSGYATSTSEAITIPPEKQKAECDFKLSPGGFHGVLLCSGKRVPEGVGIYLWKKVEGAIALRQAADAKLNEHRRETSTDANGEFTFTEISDGDYFIHVPEYQLWPAPVKIQADSGNTVNIELPGISELKGKICNADGSPVGNTTIHLHSGDQDYSIGSYHTDKEGNYVIKHVALRNYALSIIKSVSDQSAQHPREVTVYTSPVQVANITFPLLTGSISGQLTDDNGQPKPGVQIGVEYLDSPHRAILAGWVLTDAEGKYSVPRLEAGRHVVRTAWTDDEVVFSDIIELKDGESKEVNLIAPRITGKRVKGHLITSDGAPLAGSFAFAIDKDGRQSGNFFANFNWCYGASFEIKGLKQGDYTLVFTSMGCKKQAVNLNVSTDINNYVVIMQPE